MPQGYKLFSCSNQLTIGFIMLINVGILAFISTINTISESLKDAVFIFQQFSFYGQLKFHAHLI